MGLSSSIQFREVENVLSAFENRKVEAWSISQGKQFMFKGIGYEDFKTVVETLSESQSNATYTVSIYEDITDIKNIKNNTPNDGSYNFKFNDELSNNNYEKRIGYTGKADNLILSKLAGIEDRLNRIDEEVIEETKPQTLGVIGDILAHPAIAPIAPKIIETFLQLIMGKQEAPPQNNYQLQQVPKINAQQNNPGYASASISGINEDQILHETIAKLKIYDAKLLEHLQKLLLIAENDNSTFNIIVKSLD